MIDAFTKSREQLLHDVDNPTKKLILQVNFHKGKPCKRADLFVLYGGTGKKLKDGIRVDEKAAEERKNMVKGFLGSAGPMLFERMDAGGGSEMACLLTGPASAGYLPDRITDALVANVAVQQAPKGTGTTAALRALRSRRAIFFRTAVAIRALKGLPRAEAVRICFTRYTWVD